MNTVCIQVAETKLVRDLQLSIFSDTNTLGINQENRVNDEVGWLRVENILMSGGMTNVPDIVCSGFSHFVKSGQSNKHLLSTYCGHASRAEHLDFRREDRHLAHVLHLPGSPRLSSALWETEVSRIPCLPGMFNQGRHWQRLADGEDKSPCLFRHCVASPAVPSQP